MSAYLITGSSGIGKSAVLRELARRGFTTYADEFHVTTNFLDTVTGQQLQDWPPHPINVERYHWNWDVPALTKLLENSPDPTFVAGITANTTDTFQLYKTVFVLLPSVENLKQRILSRTDNNYGKHPDELAHIIETFDQTGNSWRKLGAVIIDANPPVEKVVDTILSHINKPDHIA